jgi:hypothetical protein
MPYSQNLNGKRKTGSIFYSSKLVSQRIAEEIASHFTQKTALKNDFHLVEGHHSNENLFLETGFMRSYAYDVDGNEARQTSIAKTRLFLKYPHFFNRAIPKENITENCNAKLESHQQFQPGAWHKFHLRNKTFHTLSF